MKVIGWTVWFINASGAVREPEFPTRRDAEKFIKAMGIGDSALLMPIVDVEITEG